MKRHDVDKSLYKQKMPLQSSEARKHSSFTTHITFPPLLSQLHPLHYSRLFFAITMQTEDCILNSLLSEYCYCSIFLFFVYTKGKVSPGLSFETDADFAFLSFVSRRARLVMSFDFSEKFVSFVRLEVESIIEVTFPYAD